MSRGSDAVTHSDAASLELHTAEIITNRDICAPHGARRGVRHPASLRLSFRLVTSLSARRCHPLALPFDPLGCERFKLPQRSFSRVRVLCRNVILTPGHGTRSVVRAGGDFGMQSLTFGFPLSAKENLTASCGAVKKLQHHPVVDRTPAPFLQTLPRSNRIF